jgi:two-component system NarL family sensor kinase
VATPNRKPSGNVKEAIAPNNVTSTLVAERSNPTVARAVTIFVAGGLAAVVLISAVTVMVVRRSATKEAIRNARDVAHVEGRSVVQPRIDDRLLAGDPAALAAIDWVVRKQVLSGRVVRVKIWTPEGVILYSDEPRLIGQRFALDVEGRAAVRTGIDQADLSNLNAPENQLEKPFHKLLEVYVPIATPTGHLLLFEAYLRFSSVTADGRHILTSVAPALVGGLVLLFLVQVPLAWSLARRLEEGRREREALLVRAIDASGAERRRIARDLHDGVVQSLAGVSFSLAAAAERDGLGRDIRDVLQQAAGDTRAGLRDLRTLIVEIAPPDLHDEGLEEALAGLVAPLEENGLEVHVAVDARVAVDAEVEELLYRVAQEGVRNVAAHASAHRVDISVAVDGEHIRLVVADDGRGFSDVELEARRREGHMGLRLLAGMVADAGGAFDVDSDPGRGTRVSVELPVRAR